MVEVIHRLGWKYVSTVAVEGDYGEKVSAPLRTLPYTRIPIYYICTRSNVPLDGHISLARAWAANISAACTERAVKIFIAGNPYTGRGFQWYERSASNVFACLLFDWAVVFFSSFFLQ